MTHGQDCFFPFHLSSNETETGEFGAELEDVSTPCIIRWEQLHQCRFLIQVQISVHFALLHISSFSDLLQKTGF